jgi:hypothetical protein
MSILVPICHSKLKHSTYSIQTMYVFHPPTLQPTSPSSHHSQWPCLLAQRQWPPLSLSRTLIMDLTGGHSTLLICPARNFNVSTAPSIRAAPTEHPLLLQSLWIHLHPSSMGICSETPSRFHTLGNLMFQTAIAHLRAIQVQAHTHRGSSPRLRSRRNGRSLRSWKQRLLQSGPR